jgi:phage/plasmid-associated DNA primase
MDILLGLLPKDAISTVSPHDWDDRFLPTQMHRKLLNFCGEISEAKLIAGDLFKLIVEGGQINGQLKGGQIFPFKVNCAQWFASNHLPRSRDGSGGFTRRWLILKFDHACPPELARVDLAREILAEEREAIASWALPAIADLEANNKYTEPASHKDTLAHMASTNNSVHHFLTSADVDRRQGASWDETAAYNAYVWFCTISKSKPVNLVRFHTLMQELQSIFHFKAEVDKDAGGQITVYRGIGPVSLIHRRRA